MADTADDLLYQNKEIICSSILYPFARNVAMAEDKVHPVPWVFSFSILLPENQIISLFYQAQNIVADPVMVATSGSSLMENRTVRTLKERLIPLADIITPNISNAVTAVIPYPPKQVIVFKSA